MRLVTVFGAVVLMLLAEFNDILYRYLPNIDYTFAMKWTSLDNKDATNNSF